MILSHHGLLVILLVIVLEKTLYSDQQTGSHIRLRDKIVRLACRRSVMSQVTVTMQSLSCRTYLMLTFLPCMIIGQFWFSLNK
jgi:hypothetical protein